MLEENQTLERDRETSALINHDDLGFSRRVSLKKKAQEGEDRLARIEIELLNIRAELKELKGR